MDIAKVFDQSLKKKRDLRSNSTDREGLKKLMEGSLDVGSVSDIPEDGFCWRLKISGMCCNFVKISKM